MVMTTATAGTTGAADEVLLAARRDGRDVLLEHEVYAVLVALGFQVPQHAFWPGEPGTALPGDVRALLASCTGGCVLKIVSPGLLHKTDVGGVTVAAADGPSL